MKQENEWPYLMDARIEASLQGTLRLVTPYVALPLIGRKPRKRNRDGTWRKKCSDAGKTMSNNRDTQFKGFAELLWGELREVDVKVTNGVDAYHEQCKAIAQRAYDLVQHAIVELSCRDALDFSNSGFDKYEYAASEMVEVIPDMTELPDYTLADLFAKHVNRESYPVITHGRFMEMLADRGLSIRPVFVLPGSQLCFDITKDDRFLEQYSSNIFPCYFTEKDMEEELDKLEHPDYDSGIHGIRSNDNE